MVEAMMRLLAVSPVVLTPAGQIAMATQLCTALWEKKGGMGTKSVNDP